MKSILQNEKECYICKTRIWLERHHIFGGSNRKWSEKYGLTVYLCHNHHNEPPEGVHFSKRNGTALKQIGQTAFEACYPELDFVKIFGRNYLD